MICCHSCQRRSQFAWKNQKIGSKAAASGVDIVVPHAGCPASCACQIPLLKRSQRKFCVALAIKLGMSNATTLAAIVDASKRIVRYPAG